MDRRFSAPLLGLNFSCICFFGLAAWFQPYESPAVNLFKVMTEITLLLTLVIAALLKVDMAGEELPEGIAAPDGQGVDEDDVGLVLFIANTAVPVAGMVLGYIEFGLDAKDAREASGVRKQRSIDHGVVQGQDERAVEVEFDGEEFDNPVNEDEEASTSASAFEAEVRRDASANMDNPMHDGDEPSE